jgi:hypothetical protein
MIQHLGNDHYLSWSWGWRRNSGKKQLCIKTIMHIWGLKNDQSLSQKKKHKNTVHYLMALIIQFLDNFVAFQ